MSAPTNIKLINNTDEITKILQKFLKFKTEIEIVQNDDGDELVVMAEVKNINVETKEIYLRPLNDDGFNMDGTVKIIFSNEFGNIEFEAKASDFIKRTVAKFRFPSTIRIENLRSSQRMYLEERQIKADINIEGNGEQSIEIIDISNTGIGLRGDKENNQFKSGDNVSIKKVGNKTFEPALDAKIVYSKEATTEDGASFMKVGVQFNEPLEEIEEVIAEI